MRKVLKIAESLAIRFVERVVDRIEAGEGKSESDIGRATRVATQMTLSVEMPIELIEKREDDAVGVEIDIKLGGQTAVSSGFDEFVLDATDPVRIVCRYR